MFYPERKVIDNKVSVCYLETIDWHFYIQGIISEVNIVVNGGAGQTGKSLNEKLITGFGEISKFS